MQDHSSFTPSRCSSVITLYAWFTILVRPLFTDFSSWYSVLISKNNTIMCKSAHFLHICIYKSASISLLYMYDIYITDEEKVVSILDAVIKERTVGRCLMMVCGIKDFNELINMKYNLF